MAHNLDITEGIASFVTARVDAWHSLGTTLPDAFNAADALHYGHLADWNLRKAPVFGQDPSTGEMVPVADQFSVLRDNPVNGTIDSLGIVGDRYHILQNEELVGLLDTLVDESGAHFETAGAIDGGRKVFVTMKMPGHIKVGGVDRVDQYLAAVTSHDGSTATSLMVTPVRIVCQNTLNMAFDHASNTFRVRHLKGAQSRLLEQARQSLDFTFDFLDGFQTEAYRMINTELTDAQFFDIVNGAFGPEKDQPQISATRRENQVAEMMHLFTTASTQSQVRNTVWGGMNALTEWADHFSPIRAGGGAANDQARHRKAVMDPAFKNRARELFLPLV